MFDILAKSIQGNVNFYWTKRLSRCLFAAPTRGRKTRRHVLSAIIGANLSLFPRNGKSSVDCQRFPGKSSQKTCKVEFEEEAKIRVVMKVQ